MLTNSLSLMIRNSKNTFNRIKFIYAVIILFFLISSGLSAQNAYIKLCLEAIEFEKEGKLNDAVSKYNAAINLKPQVWDAYSYRAKVYYRQEKYDEAISDLSKAIDLSPKNTGLYGLRANCHEAKGNFEKAVIDYDLALSKGSGDKEAYLRYFQRGRLYFNNNKYMEAVRDFTKSLQLAKEAKASINNVYNLLGRSLVELKNYTEAIKDFELHLASDPGNIEALFYQGYAYLKNGETAAARTNALKLIELDPSKEVCFSDDKLLEIYDLETRRGKTKQLTDDAISLLDEYQNLSSKALANIKLEDAFSNLDTAWLLGPGLVKEDRELRDTILKRMFYAYSEMKNKPEASEVARKYMVQARNATTEKKYNESIVLWSKALNISPYFPVAYYNRALLYGQLGNYRNSIADMKKYLELLPDASDARSAQDKIYEWEGKLKEKPEPALTNNYTLINKIDSKKYSPGNFIFSLAFGGGGGFQLTKNTGLADFWAQTNPEMEIQYDDKVHVLFSGDIEMVIKPIKKIGIGAFGKLTGGTGVRNTVSGTKYNLNMASNQYGGLVRYYFIVNDLALKPDLYIQYAYGINNLDGFYGISGSNSIYTYMKSFKGSAPWHSAGIGMGGKLGKMGYLILSADYHNSTIGEIKWKITTNDGDPSQEGTEGILINTADNSNIKAYYHGIMLRLLFGFCF